MAAIELKDIVALAIASYGALLSTFNFVQIIRKEQRRLVVTIRENFISSSDGKPGRTISISIVVVNQSQRPIVVNEPQFRLPNGRFVVPSHVYGADADFPKRLEDGETTLAAIRNADLSASLRRHRYSGKVKIRPVCVDTTGREHRGKKLLFDIDARTG